MSSHPTAPLRSAFAALLLFTGIAAAAVTPPVAISTPAPDYPKALLDQAIEGSVTVVITIGTDGKVHDAVAMIATHAEFAEVAVETIKTWEFKPATKDGKPVEIRVKQVLPFTIPDDRKVEALVGRKVFVEEPWGIRDDMGAIAGLRLLEITDPEYPPGLKGSGATGDVEIHFFVNSEGLACNPTVAKSSDPAFNLPVMLAVLRARWEPPTDGSSPISVRNHFRFKISEKKVTRR